MLGASLSENRSDFLILATYVKAYPEAGRCRIPSVDLEEGPI